MTTLTLRTPALSDMFRRLLQAKEQTRAARSVEVFGWVDLVLGSVILLAPDLTAAVLQLPTLTDQGGNYLRLVGLLVGGLGMLYVVAGRLNAQGFVFASLLDRPLVPGIMALLWHLEILPGPLALAFSVTDFGGFLWTLSAWRADARDELHAQDGLATREDRDARDDPEARRTALTAGIAAGIFGFTSGVVRNARTFHPDGRVFRGTVRSLHPADSSLARAAEGLAGSVLLRIGMGMVKKGAPRWLADRIPDAPSIAMRIYSSATGEIRLERRPGEDLDLLCTAGGDRLWKLLLNLATGGFMYGLRQFDYFRNTYHADVPYRIDGGKLDVRIRLVPDRAANEAAPASAQPAPVSPQDGPAREADLTNAIGRHALVRIEAQRVGAASEPFVAIAEIRFEEEIQIDQEALHFDPVAGRGFEPHGFLTELRRSVYPASAQSRPPSAQERVRREDESISRRLGRYFKHRTIYPSETGAAVMSSSSAVMSAGAGAMSAAPGGDAPTTARRRWIRIACFSILGVVVVFGVYLAIRLTRDRPVEYADDVRHFEYGSTGGEKMNGIPYWFWVAMPEIFSDRLPDKRPGRGYSSFGLIYEKGKDPRYDLPIGTSMRNWRGIDVVYLNCASCHTGTVRDAPGADPHVVPGMPAHTFDLGAFGHFLTSIPASEKFNAQRFLDQIGKMQDDPHRLIDKPDFINRLIFRFYAVSLMREKLLMFGDRLSFIRTDTWGPGRVDTFNAPKGLLNFPMQYADPKELMGNVDFPSIWNQGPRKGMQLHWDGNNTSVDERNLSAAFGTGAFPPNLDARRLLRTAKWLETARPLGYLYHVDQTLAARGKPVYEEYCTGCHGWRDPPFRNNPPRADELVGTVVPIDRIGTDRGRLDSYTWVLAVNQSTLYAGYEKDWGFKEPYPQRFSHFRKEPGYANLPLDGIWLRGPYLHNGSVPNLRELLEPAAARSKVFFIGNDVYDPEDVGFVSNVPGQDGRAFFRFDTGKPGNGNGGHEGPVYGTDLPAEEKRALLEYLKTF
jgi:hypothetical protein